MNSQYTVVLYHGNCYDGFGAAYAAWRALGDQATYRAVLYGQEPPTLRASDRVLICDFSYPRDVLLTLRDCVAALHIIDHHKTAQEALAGLDFAEFNLAHSGAWLTWRHFHGEPVPPFIEYLEDRDLWRFALPDSKGISEALRAYPFDFGIWNSLTVEQLRGEAPVVARLTEQMVRLMSDHARMGTVGGFTVPIANATAFFSEVGDELCRRFPNAPFAAYYMDREDGLRQWGLRARGGFDTSVVAKRFGGGGHPGASGFTEVIPNGTIE